MKRNLSICIPCHNIDVAGLIRTLDKIAALKNQPAVVIVDDASHPRLELESGISTKLSDLMLRRLDTNQGTLHARRLGVDLAKRESV